MALVDFLVLDGDVPADQRGACWQLVFDDTLPSGTCTPTATGWVLSGDWKTPQARFAPFALVQAFVQTMMRLRPRRVVLHSIHSASAELARLSLAMGLQVEVLNRPTPDSLPSDTHARRWLQGLMYQIDHPAHLSQPQAQGSAAGMAEASAISAPAWDYGLYALGMRDHDLLLRMHAPDVQHFAGCKQVLDVGCGTGIMLEALARAGIAAQGVDRNPQSIRYAASLGLKVQQQDALDYLTQQTGRFDGLYCSHFVEHLPMEAVDRLIGLCAQALQPGGVAVFTFPDPESIRSQLLGFWRDPEHVRFYHPELIASVAAVHGLALEYNSQNLPGRRVGPFSLQAPAMPAAAPGSAPTLWQRIAQRLGLALPGQLEALQHQIDHQQKLIDQLWQVNQTWAWEDNVVLKFRKPPA